MALKINKTQKFSLLPFASQKVNLLAEPVGVDHDENKKSSSLKGRKQMQHVVSAEAVSQHVF